MTDIVKIRDATLYHGDCLEILPTLEKVDAVVTDPPYGLEKRTKKADYDTELFQDTPDYVSGVCRSAVDMSLSIAERGAVSCGLPNVYKYAPADCIGAFVYPSAASWCNWGTPSISPILLYGKRPKNRLGAIHKTVYSSDSDANAHPCAKPTGPWTWLVDSVSGEKGEIILDPFMGSGTTGVACANLGRKFIGIEIERKYFDIACERIEAAYAQGRLFE